MSGVPAGFGGEQRDPFQMERTTPLGVVVACPRCHGSLATVVDALVHLRGWRRITLDPDHVAACALDAGQQYAATIAARDLAVAALWRGASALGGLADAAPR